MNTLNGTYCSLRALEPADIDVLFAIENNEDFWEVSSTQTPFSKFILQQYLSNAHQDIYEAKQFRFVIEDSNTKKAVGTLDLFDFNPQHQRVGIGILVTTEHQEKGLASEALSLGIQYCFTHLNIHQLYANITADNTKSLALFEKQQFQQIGVKKDWIRTNNGFKDELLFQRIKKDSDA